MDQTKPLNLIAIAGAISAPIKGYFTMQRNANMLKNSKKSAFLQILWVSLKKCSPLSVPRIHFCSSVRFYKTLNTNWLNLSFYILCGKIKTLHRQVGNVLICCMLAEYKSLAVACLRIKPKESH